MGSNPTERPRTLYEEAKVAVSAGLSVVPPAQDGTKKPFGRWEFFQREIAPRPQLRRWYANGQFSGIGVVCGKVSGNLECLEFDDLSVYRTWKDTAESLDLEGIVERIEAGYLDETPGGGMHLLYRCDEIGGNEKLAQRPTEPHERKHEKDKYRTLIETRGEGGYAVCAPSGGSVHPSGKSYRRIRGGFATIATISADERRELFRLAEAFHQVPDEHPLPPIGSTKVAGDGDRPGDVFNARASWADVLTPYGWVYLYSRGEESFWRRPGKDRGQSATTNYRGSDVLKVFTSSTEFEAERTYTKFGAYAVLNHGGDMTAAARDLAHQGYKAERAGNSLSGGTSAEQKHSANDSGDNAAPDASSNQGKKGEASSKLPRLDAGCQDLALMTGLAWSAVAKRNDPPLMFTYAGEPIRLDPGEGDDRVPRPLTTERLRHEAARAAEWFTVKKVKDDWVESAGKPSKDLIADMLAAPAFPLPSLTRIVSAPVFGADGNLQTTPGYHPSSRTYYHAPAGFALPDVSSAPTADEVDEARGWILDELLVDFPFVSDADRAHAVAELLVIPARAMIGGATPMHVHEAPTQGTGKDLLAEAMGIVVLGREPHTMSYGREPEEFEKRLVATLRTMPEWVVLPNVRGEVTNDALADAISRGMFTGRILGLSDMARLPARNVWTLTANNAELSADFTRRSIRIRLDAQMERPQARVDFKHAPLKPWIAKHRPRLVWATLTLIRAWVAAGRPSHTGPSIGGFEEWSATIGGILDRVGIPGFLTNLDEFYQAADGEAITRRAFVAAWWERLGRDAVGTASLYPIAIEDEIGMDLGDRNEQGRKSRLGHILKTMRDRRYTLPNGYTVRVTFTGTGANANRYALELIDRGEANR